VSQAVAVRPAAYPAVGPSDAGSRLRLDVRKLDRAEDLPPEVEHLRIELHDRGRKLGKLDLRRIPGTGWRELVERWVREERLPRLLPRHLRRHAWRDRRLLRRLLRLAAERRTWRHLWDTLHTAPGRWPGRLRSYLVARQEVLLPSKRAQPAGDVTEAPAAAVPHVWDRAKWESVFAAPDPWGYTSPYEQRKYEHTLKLLPEGPPPGRALELACAEGHFTVQLAPRVGALLAADIAANALERAQARCRDFGHVRFAQLDLRTDEIPGRFGLIVCSEVLYYVGNRFDLARVACKLAGALEPGGHLLVTHADAVVDDPSATGFDWQVGFAAKRIGEVLARLPSLEFLRELRTPIYRVQLFRRAAAPARRPPRPREVILAEAAELGDLERSLNRGGCVVTRTEAANAWVTRRLPVLMYHQIAADGPAALAPYRVAPAAFERQLAYLRRHGYRAIALDEWLAALVSGDGRIEDRVVALTFDDAYRDFLTDAWPLLKRYGFTATLFVATDHVGGRAEWDRGFGEPAPILGWDELRRLAAEGVAVGAHSGSHPYLTRVAPADMVAEGRRSKEALERELGRPVNVMAYPYGDQDLLVRRAMAACGFAGAVTTAPGFSRLGDNPMAMPRQLVDGADDLDRFVAKLGTPTRATLDRRLRYRYVRWAGENLM
jgi:peptidoglycan/xylan/chitin deacetylase (PgdA/CDA1 family)/SAM-dependent methyltransferase